MKYRNKKFALFVAAVILVPFILPFVYNLIFEGGIKEDDGSDYIASMVLGFIFQYNFSCSLSNNMENMEWKDLYSFLCIAVAPDYIRSDRNIDYCDCDRF